MKRLLSYLLVLMLLAVLLSRPMTPSVQARSMRLFLIGNSFSQNATTYLPQIAKEGGHELTIGRAESPGAPLQRHWEAVEAAEANPADPKGKLYSGKSLRELLSVGTWDIVTIQQGSITSAFLDSYHPYAQNLYNFVKKLQPNAEVVMHQTWPYRSDSRDFSYVAANGVQAGSDREMFEKLLVAYHTVASELNVRLMPVGEAFWRVNSDPQWGYKKDTNFDFAKPVFPNLPEQTHSLNVGYRWEDQTKFGIDSHHANDAGKYLGGLVWYGVLFNESPEKVNFAPASVPADFAAHLRQVAARVTLSSPLSPTPATVRPVAPATVSAPATPSTPVSPPVASQPQAQTQTGNPGLTTLVGKGADTSIRGGSWSARAWGAEPILRVSNQSELEHTRKAYLRFDLSTLLSPAKSAKSATLLLTSGPGVGTSPADKVWTFQVFGLKDGARGEDWGEATTTCDNAPANDTKSPSALTEDAVALGTFTITGAGEAGKTASFSSPELLKFLKIDTDGLATLIIKRQEEGGVVHIFASKENKGNLAGPNLNVTY